MKRVSSRKAIVHANRQVSLAGMMAIFLLASGAFASPFLLAAPDGKDAKPKTQAAQKSSKALPTGDRTEDEAVLHALNRLGFGPRPGDLELVKQMGLQNWIEEQLNPNSINDVGLEDRLQRFPTLKMTSAKLLEEFPEPQMAARRQGITVEQYRQQQQQMMREAMAQGQGNAQGDMQPANQSQGAQSDMQSADALRMPSFDAVDDNLNPNPPKGKGQGKGQGAIGSRMVNYEQIRLPQRIVAELSMAKMTRAIYSERQLNEMMVDFWYNHFNVFAAKGADRWLITDFEENAIRPNAMGKFRDLLEATAKSPAMLFYLDNWLSADPVAWQKLQEQMQNRRAMRGGPFAGGQGRPGVNGIPNDPNNPPAKQPQERGLNENYGRELMELHTLGVDGGYTQDDVINVAKAFTGWSIRQPRRDPEFFFEERLHDTSVKTVLGRQIRGGGMKDGEEVLDILARDPHTAHHISFELAQRFVTDNPPPALVDRMAQTFLKSDGDIREVLRTMIYSPEFWSKDAYRSKIKTPFELVASATRAVGAEVAVPLVLVQWTSRIGEPLYQCEPPTGYSDKADAWVNTGALLNRLNFSLALTSGRLRGAQVDVNSLFSGDTSADPKATLESAIHLLLGGEVSQQTRDTLAQQMEDPQILQATLDDKVKQVNTAMIAGLVLGSPEFQRR
ncbi:MAG TPA: DUF1800 domain-containing protein [Verrucomicrobiae bacterium]|jgi:uncharacterized protein (DUF1800 family)|nr:DUF1800 domain-containing protein [Verrucomicrobiae bacterium]